MLSQLLCKRVNILWNYYALIVAVLKGISPEEAFELLETGKRPKHKKLSTEEVAEMASLKETMTYKDIGTIYNMKPTAVYTRIRRYKGVI